MVVWVSGWKAARHTAVDQPPLEWYLFFCSIKSTCLYWLIRTYVICMSVFTWIALVLHAMFRRIRKLKSIYIFNDKPNIYSIRIIIHTWNEKRALNPERKQYDFEWTEVYTVFISLLSSVSLSRSHCLNFNRSFGELCVYFWTFLRFH